MAAREEAPGAAAGAGPGLEQEPAAMAEPAPGAGTGAEVESGAGPGTVADPGAGPGAVADPGAGSGPERPELCFEEEEVQHEEELLRNPECPQLSPAARQRGPRPRLNQIYERALRELPGSYKLWYQYLAQVTDVTVTMTMFLFLVTSCGTSTCRSAGRRSQR
ncbi:circumsporozoite protein-like [Catharus ustulatus]|uniref:circumsporozoite protein-like n=1 Tax=Catharus ustulatus TaxID=91951 RepID=UPI00140A3223|nr:circumsporozoite protein-like [Catharus ustulatus]